jgi:hypothetical protein
VVADAAPPGPQIAGGTGAARTGDRGASVWRISGSGFLGLIGIDYRMLFEILKTAFNARRRATRRNPNLMKKTSLLIPILAVAALFVVAGHLPSLRGLEDGTASSAPIGKHRTYTTSFPLAENPVSEHGNWVCGKTAAVDWADIATIPGLAYGLESGIDGFDDSTALLTGSWGPNQTAQATVHTVNQGETVWEEVELRLRSALSAHSATGYEINFRCLKSKNAYTEIVRWDGPLAKFTYLSHKDGEQYGVADGDVIKATIVGNVIKVYKNGVLVNQATDSTFATGSPGIGFFIKEKTGKNSDYGFTSFMATDGE